MQLSNTNFIKRIFLIHKNQQGLGLVEVIAAFGISIVVITSLVSLALYTVRSSLNSKLLLEGTKLATREMESVRAYRDTSVSWDQFIDDVDSGDGDGYNCTCAAGASSCSLQCSISVDPTLGVQIADGLSIEMIDNQEMTRYFYLIPDQFDPQNIVRVYVRVVWNLGGVERDTHIYTDLANWQSN